MQLNPFANLLNKIPAVRLVSDEILNMPEPDYVVLPMDYTQRELYSWQVEIGDQVRQYQIIARNSMGVCLHTPISGTVHDIKPIWSERGIHIPAVYIKKGEGTPVSADEIFYQYGVSRKNATVDDQLKAMGIHPPWQPLIAPSDSKQRTRKAITNIVIVGFDEEPGICIQYNLLNQKFDEILQGFHFLKEILPSSAQILLTDKQTSYQIKSNLPEEINLKSVPPQYPARLLDTIIPKLTDIKFNNTRDYTDQGTVVITVERLLVLMAALKKCRPFTTKYLSISMKSPSKQRTVQIHHGTSIRSVMQFADFSVSHPECIIAGGPMKGVAQFNDLTPLTRSSDGIHLLGKKDVMNNPGDSCINCGACARICPINLQVHLIGRYVEFSDFSAARDYHPEYCIECGLCSYVCPAQRPLVQLIQLCNQYSNQENEHKPQIECSIESPLEEWSKHCPSAATVADCSAACH